MCVLEGGEWGGSGGGTLTSVRRSASGAGDSVRLRGVPPPSARAVHRSPFSLGASPLSRRAAPRRTLNPNTYPPCLAHSFDHSARHGRRAAHRGAAVPTAASARRVKKAADTLGTAARPPVALTAAGEELGSTCCLPSPFPLRKGRGREGGGGAPGARLRFLGGSISAAPCCASLSRLLCIRRARPAAVGAWAGQGLRERLRVVPGLSATVPASKPSRQSRAGTGQSHVPLGWNESVIVFWWLLRERERQTRLLPPAAPACDGPHASEVALPVEALERTARREGAHSLRRARQGARPASGAITRRRAGYGARRVRRSPRGPAGRRPRPPPSSAPPQRRPSAFRGSINQSVN